MQPQHCSPPSEHISSFYVNGTLYVSADKSKRLDSLVVTDTSDVVERMQFSAHAKKRKKFSVTEVTKHRATPLQVRRFPLKWRSDGVRLTSAWHKRDEVHIEPQRKRHLAKFSETRPKHHRASPSVYMLILDSVSWNSMRRYAPVTSSYLDSHSLSKAWKMYRFPRFHAYRGGTADNMLPCLSGVVYNASLNSARRSSWSCEVFRKSVPESSLLWNAYKAAGYVTAFGATGCNGMVGTRNCQQWLKHFDHVAPALDVDVNCPTQHEWSPEAGCVGSKRPHEHMFSYFERLFEIYQDMPTFAYLHLETAHEDQERGLALIDAALTSHLRRIASLPSKARPIVLLAGDHGSSREAQWLHPFVTLAIPRLGSGLRLLHRKEAASLRRNQHAMVSWLDVYRTFRYFASISARPHLTRERKMATPRWLGRSILLPLPRHRSCQDAGIPGWQCVHHQSWKENCLVPDSHIHMVLNRFLADVNKELHEGGILHDPCPPLELLVPPLHKQRRAFRCKAFPLLDALPSGQFLLRITFTTKQGMQYEMHIEALQILKGNRNTVHIGRLVEARPLSRYREHEDCVPAGWDAAFCPCMKRSV
eukprot:TRINITY_DN10033_c0_g1_i3.p1 TRINITY_DN10033_c0_g1~~TRINITY_DN10033_c0_g1_i3.p1  ORF type:complete len:590 (-),score=24.75 TRINITY_DN10033_c0_g1_i3:67-1836(-)